MLHSAAPPTQFNMFPFTAAVMGQTQPLGVSQHQESHTYNRHIIFIFYFIPLQLLIVNICFSDDIALKQG